MVSIFTNQSLDCMAHHLVCLFMVVRNIVSCTCIAWRERVALLLGPFLFYREAMTITNKDSILKKWYEHNGQQTMFGYDNLEFKTINHPTPHRFVELCSEFKLKKSSNIISRTYGNRIKSCPGVRHTITHTTAFFASTS